MKRCCVMEIVGLSGGAMPGLPCGNPLGANGAVCREHWRSVPSKLKAEWKKALKARTDLVRKLEILGRVEAAAISPARPA